MPRQASTSSPQRTPCVNNRRSGYADRIFRPIGGAFRLIFNYSKAKERIIASHFANFTAHYVEKKDKRQTFGDNLQTTASFYAVFTVNSPTNKTRNQNTTTIWYAKKHC